MADKTLSLLGLARRAGKVLGGFDLCAGAARDGQARLLLAAEDISDKTYKNLCYEAKRAGVPCARVRAPIAELGKACGLRAGVLAVTDEGFSQALLEQDEAVKLEGGICV